jgi:hypothetical protein
MYDDPDYNTQEESTIDTAALQAAFRAQLLACLEECSRGRHGLFSHHELAGENAWPEAARLRELAFALQSILAQVGAVNPLIEQFLDLCSMHGESNPGEPKLARAFLDHIAAEQL